MSAENKEPEGQPSEQDLAFELTLIDSRLKEIPIILKEPGIPENKLEELRREKSRLEAQQNEINEARVRAREKEAQEWIHPDSDPRSHEPDAPWVCESCKCEFAYRDRKTIPVADAEAHVCPTCGSEDIFPNHPAAQAWYEAERREREEEVCSLRPQYVEEDDI
ncbi:MAG: hypothetical protein PHW53_01895 [Patescibacteria group bacterium]|nr:hypothetical protein [Patescibacteria group bacterium]